LFVKRKVCETIVPAKGIALSCGDHWQTQTKKGEASWQ